MRFQHWDVLLFPAGDASQETNHIPLQEFRTACYVEKATDATDRPAPLLTTFVPSLPRDSPFQISLHSWTQTRASSEVTHPFKGKVRELWQVVIVVDGVKACVKTFDVEEKWPQVIASSTMGPTGHAPHELKFPRFHRIIMGQNHWDASDLLGRIRVELSSGYADSSTAAGFVKLHDVVNFAFQPAPIDLLEQTAIAWPNHRMFTNGIPPGCHNRMRAPTVHKRSICPGNVNVSLPLLDLPAYQASVTSSSPSYPMAHSNASSRSTSNDSILDESTASLLPNGVQMPMIGTGIGYATKQDGPHHFRLPSDQLQMIVRAIAESQQHQTTQQAQQEPVPAITTPVTTMPPPPLPAHAMLSKDVTCQTLHGLTATATADRELDSSLASENDRRQQSHYSDVSMHAGCTDFPSCTSEDTEGRVVHNARAPPAEVVKGRKEGSSAVKPRDFVSQTLETAPLNTEAVASTEEAEAAASIDMEPVPSLTKKDSVMPRSSSPPHKAEQSGDSVRKRTRSALGSMNLNDGSAVDKPPRKVSRNSAKADQENMPAETGIAGPETMMVDV